MNFLYAVLPLDFEEYRFTILLCFGNHDIMNIVAGNEIYFTFCPCLECTILNIDEHMFAHLVQDVRLGSIFD